MKRYILTVAVVQLLTVATALSQDGLALMKVETGARPAGMGGAFVSIAADPHSAVYNPAGAVNASKFTAAFGCNSYWTNIRIETGCFVADIANRTWLHGGIRYAVVSDLESRVGPSSEPDALFDAHDVSFKGGLSYKIGSNLAAGFAVGWFIEKIDVYRGSALNIDLGLLYEIKPDLNLGLSVLNVGSGLSLAEASKPAGEEISLPVTYRFGSSYKYDRYLGTADLVVQDGILHVHAGAEVWLHDYVALRSGYMVNYDSKNYTAGASFVHRNFTIGYAFVLYTNSLGTSHLFNLTVTL